MAQGRRIAAESPQPDTSGEDLQRIAATKVEKGITAYRPTKKNIRYHWYRMLYTNADE